VPVEQAELGLADEFDCFVTQRLLARVVAEEFGRKQSREGWSTLSNHCVADRSAFDRDDVIVACHAHVQP
jgi:hypothetical protein